MRYFEYRTCIAKIIKLFWLYFTDIVRLIEHWNYFWDIIPNNRLLFFQLFCTLDYNSQFREFVFASWAIKISFSFEVNRKNMKLGQEIYVNSFWLIIFNFQRVCIWNTQKKKNLSKRTKLSWIKMKYVKQIQSLSV